MYINDNNCDNTYTVINHTSSILSFYFHTYLESSFSDFDLTYIT